MCLRAAAGGTETNSWRHSVVCYSQTADRPQRETKTHCVQTSEHASNHKPQSFTGDFCWFDVSAVRKQELRVKCLKHSGISVLIDSTFRKTSRKMQLKTICKELMR